VSTDRVEAELKYRAQADGPLRQLAGVPRLGAADLGAPRIVDEVDRYLDTADLRLAAVRWACRLRSREGSTVLSLKGPAEHAPGDLLHRRPEIEGPAHPGLDPGGWPPSRALDRLLAMTGGQDLFERFVLEQQRTERVVSSEGTRVGLLSLDRLRVLRQGDELGRLAVVELELDSGAMASGFDHAPLAAALSAVPGLVADPSSKFELALALLAAA
jgi:inorganic triphosphatase YgiF